jgi:hypothetical protein
MTFWAMSTLIDRSASDVVDALFLFQQAHDRSGGNRNGRAHPGETKWQRSTGRR